GPGLVAQELDHLVGRAQVACDRAKLDAAHIREIVHRRDLLESFIICQMRRDVEKRIGTDAQLLDLVSADALHPPYEWNPARISRVLVLHLVEPQPAEIDRRELQSGHVVRTLLRADRRNIPRVRAHPRGKPGGEHAFDLGEEIDRGAAITIFEYGDL